MDKSEYPEDLFFVIVTLVISEKDREELFRVLTENYITKKAGDNIFLIKTEERGTKEIHQKIFKALDRPMGFVVVNPLKWYGSLYPDTHKWVSEKFPKANIVSGDVLDFKKAAEKISDKNG